MNVVSVFFFFIFVMLGLAVASRRRLRLEAENSYRLRNAFLLVTLSVSFTAGFAQRDMWPFSSWTMMVGVTPPATRTLPTLRIVGVDASGREYDIDSRAWQPLSLEELQSWMNNYFFRMDPAAQDRVSSYLLGRSNEAREQALSQSGLAYPNRWLGRFTAPTHILHPAIWSRPEAVPRVPLVRLKIYKESWDLEARADSPGKITRILEYEYPRL